ncbi:MAG: hypothetical protein Fur0043_02240 [Anaerolineales bacterium]
MRLCSCAAGAFLSRLDLHCKLKEAETHKRHSLLFILPAAALALAACGGGDTTGQPVAVRVGCADSLGTLVL